MKPSIILYKALPDDLKRRLEEHFTVTQVANLRPETVEQHADAFASAEGLLGSSEKVDAALLAKMPKLRAASTISVGYDTFDVDALNAKNILLMHTPTVLTETVADTIMALVLSSARRVVEVAERVKKGEWTRALVRTGLALTSTTKRLASWGWGASAWRWRNVRTLVSVCRFSITHAASIRKRKAVSRPATAIWIRCLKSLTMWFSSCRTPRKHII
jgi:gluconate 2-dehydrogenase